jgi:hypothetical protein
MDKLELDARVARLERRYGLVLALLLAVPASVLMLLVGYARMGRAEHQISETVVASPIPPSPTEWVKAAPEPFMGGMGMMGMMGGMMSSPGSMTALHQELSTLAQLLGEGVITQEEWQAKKERVLAGELHPGDLRTDLELVRQLVDAEALTEGEQASLRARLLGIEGPMAGDKPEE